MVTPPGWFPTEEEPGARRWWNGTTWEDGVEQDQRIALDHKTVFGQMLVFVPDPTWPPAPAGWFPPPLWEPAPGWRQPVEPLWQVALDDDSDMEMESARVRWELAQVNDIYARELEPDAWAVADLDAIPIVWTPPPSWPGTPPGWAPPQGWKASREWGPAPAGWEFWQRDQSVLAYRAETLRTDIEQRSMMLTSTVTGTAAELTIGDQVVCVAARMTPLALSPLPTAARAGLGAVLPQRVVVATQAAHHRLKLAVSNLRTYLLRVAYGVAETDGWCGVLRRAVEEAKEDYAQAIEDAAQAVNDVTLSTMRTELDRLQRSRLRDRQGQAAWLKSLVEPLQVDMTERIRALNSFSALRDGKADGTSTGTTDWEAAEELAATNLRQLGFTDARRTPVGTDGGFDVEGRGVVAQVKYRTHPVGRPDVQRLVGANQHGARAAFYSRAGYARAAIEYADQVGVALFTLDTARGTVKPANTWAERLHA
jgi:hypothetical protein